MQCTETTFFKASSMTWTVSVHCMYSLPLLLFVSVYFLNDEIKDQSASFSSSVKFILSGHI